MTSMIEVVAKAIYHGTPRNKAFRLLAAPHKQYWLKRARAAIEAMEPNEAMIAAGHMSLVDDIDLTDDEIKALFNAMNRAALEGERDEPR